MINDKWNERRRNEKERRRVGSLGVGCYINKIGKERTRVVAPPLRWGRKRVGKPDTRPSSADPFVRVFWSGRFDPWPSQTSTFDQRRVGGRKFRRTSRGRGKGKDRWKVVEEEKEQEVPRRARRGVAGGKGWTARAHRLEEEE